MEAGLNGAKPHHPSAPAVKAGGGLETSQVLWPFGQLAQLINSGLFHRFLLRLAVFLRMASSLDGMARNLWHLNTSFNTLSSRRISKRIAICTAGMEYVPLGLAGGFQSILTVLMA